MPDLKTIAGKFEMFVRFLQTDDAKLASVIQQVEPLFQSIYAGKLPTHQELGAVVAAVQKLFAEKHFVQQKALSDAFGKLIAACQEAMSGTGQIADRKSIVEYLRGAWNNRNCAGCGGSAWHVSEDLFELRRYDDGKVVVGADARLLAVVPVVCKACGMTLFFSAAHAGLGGKITGFADLPA
jgi:hypothetical protein